LASAAAPWKGRLLASNLPRLIMAETLRLIQNDVKCPDPAGGSSVKGNGSRGIIESSFHRILNLRRTVAVTAYNRFVARTIHRAA
jgi:hypothetical protein